MRFLLFVNLISFAVLSLLGGTVKLTADDHIVRTDRSTLQTLFDERDISSNIQAVRQQAFRKTDQARYQFLKRQVIPECQSQVLRVRGQFLATNPSPRHSIISSTLQHQLYTQHQTNIPETRRLRGGVLASPVIELIAVAKKLGQLEDLRREIFERSTHSKTEQKNRFALLFILAVESGRFEEATKIFDQLVPGMVDFIEANVAERWAELLVLMYGLRHPETHEYVGEFFVHELANHLEYQVDHAADIMIDHFRSLTGIYYSRRFVGKSTKDSRWISMSYSDHVTRGEGRPHPQWRMKNATVAKFSGHESDFLTYAIPLRGDFQVEFQISTSSNRHTGCVIGGRYLEIDWNQSQIKTGNYRKPYQIKKLEPPLAHGGNSARFRAEVSDRQLKAFFNGRLVHKETLPPDYDPWFSLRNWRRSHPEIKDLRITGSPVIPEEISLLPDPNLNGWSPYYEEGFGANQGFWSADYDEERNVILRGYLRDDIAGSGMEKLLRYHRPMIEDGTISFEFYYEPGRKIVHPALGRMAFLLDFEGVKLHWITDGRYETTGLDPFNTTLEKENRRGPKQLPLVINDWNRCELSVEGNDVSLHLNGSLIYRRTIEADNQRTFGLFHYADLTEALVRNVRWKGDWSKKIPTIHDQILADHTVDELDKMSSGLSANFRHNFANGIPRELFDFNGDETVISQRENGMATQYSSGSGLPELRLCLQLGGDFDVIAHFSDLRVTLPEKVNKRGGVGLMLWTDTLAEDSFALYRRKDWDGQKVAYARKRTNSDGDRKYTGFRYTSEATSGKLRMVRKGDRLYSLFAEGNSPNYRLVTEEEIPTEDIRPQGLRLVMQSGGNAVLTEAIWNQITIKADKIYGLPIQKESTILESLSKPPSDSITNERLIDLEQVSNFYISSNVNSKETRSAEGLRCKIEANESQSHLFIQDRLPTSPGTFDIGVEIEIHQLDAPEKMGQHSEVVLETILWKTGDGNPLRFVRPSSGPEKLSLILRQKANGIRELIARVVQRNIADRYVYLPIRSIPVVTPDKLRFVVRDGKLFYLYSESDSPEWRILAEIPFEGDLSNGMTSLHQYANGEGRVTDVTWKRLMMRSEVREDFDAP